MPGCVGRLSRVVEVGTGSEGAIMIAKHTIRRNLNLDVLRIVAMLLIVACHATLHIPWLLNIDTVPLQYLPGWKSALAFLVVQYGQVGVSIFFMISGYFLVRKDFQVRRVFSTWFQMFCYSVLSFALILVARHRSLTLPDKVTELLQGEQLPHTIVTVLFPFLSNSYWFVTAYIVMLLVSPFLNCLFEHLSQRSIGCLMLLLGFLATWKLFNVSTPVWTNFTYAILGYVTGGWIRVYGRTMRMPAKPLLLTAIIAASTVVMTVFNHHAAERTTFTTFFAWETKIKPGIEVLPIVIAAAIVLLALEVDLSWIRGFPRALILRAAASTFGIYLIHENMFWYRIIWPTITGMMPTPDTFFDKLIVGAEIVLIIFIAAGAVSFVLDTLLVHPISRMMIAIVDTADRPRRGHEPIRHARRK
ncbi:acyltransferase [Bifidobacterium sp. 82T10]|uniref:Acyltransferase n=1 Tax=Bifidobacterium miconis TaxID=2834435 RepID=A0ABS6WI85_9BIFI|nr:acyltransferase [Bifidobacterium miconis]